MTSCRTEELFDLSHTLAAPLFEGKEWPWQVLDELKDFAECGLCGTAAVISPVGKVVDHGKEICFPSGMEKMGPITQKLYDTLTGIQYGKIEAPEGWIHEIM